MPSITVLLALGALAFALLTFVLEKKIELLAIGLVLLALAVLIPA